MDGKTNFHEIWGFRLDFDYILVEKIFFLQLGGAFSMIIAVGGGVGSLMLRRC